MCSLLSTTFLDGDCTRKNTTSLYIGAFFVCEVVVDASFESAEHKDVLQSGLFVELAKRSLLFGFSFLDVAFGESPVA